MDLKIETIHNGLIHDVQCDFFGRWLATCSSDNSINVYNMKDLEQPKPLAVLTGHGGPVYKVAWSHPRFGDLLASASFDKKVKIWKEYLGTWSNIYTYDDHVDSVVSVAWSPYEHGINLLCGSMDGSITLIYHTQKEWHTTKKKAAHKIGVTCVSWGPYLTWENEDCMPVKQFVSSGMDGFIKIWTIEENRILLIKKLESHMESIRSVAWAPDIGSHEFIIASGGQDGSLIIWTKASDSSWMSELVEKLPETIYSLSWSMNARTLAVSCGPNNVSLWRRKMDKSWVCVKNNNVDNTQTSTISQRLSPNPTDL